MKKVYNTQNNIGKAKYVVNFHDGVKTHKDGSPFFDIATFGNKKENDQFIKKLTKEGYVLEDLPQNPNKITEFEALQNHLNYIRFEGLTLHEAVQQDKRTTKKYYLSIGQYSISPKLDYDQMNHFLLGFGKALKVIINK